LLKIKYHTVGIVPISNKNNSRNRDKIGIPTTHIKAFKLSNILRVVEFFVLVTAKNNRETVVFDI
jgi:hypothetical protein